MQVFICLPTQCPHEQGEGFAKQKWTSVGRGGKGVENWQKSGDVLCGSPLSKSADWLVTVCHRLRWGLQYLTESEPNSSHRQEGCQNLKHDNQQAKFQIYLFTWPRISGFGIVFLRSIISSFR